MCADCEKHMAKVKQNKTNGTALRLETGCEFSQTNQGHFVLKIDTLAYLGMCKSEEKNASKDR